MDELHKEECQFSETVLAQAWKLERSLLCLNRLFSYRLPPYRGISKGGTLLRYIGRQGLFFVSLHLQQRSSKWVTVRHASSSFLLLTKSYHGG